MVAPKVMNPAAKTGNLRLRLNRTTRRGSPHACMFAWPPLKQLRLRTPLMTPRHRALVTSTHAILKLTATHARSDGVDESVVTPAESEVVHVSDSVYGA